MDIQDTRDLEKRIDELEALEEVVKDAEIEVTEAREALDSSNGETDANKERLENALKTLQSARDDFETEQSSNDELKKLRDFRDEFDHRHWRDGIQLIAEDDFEDYARQFAEDIGAIPDDASWPCTCIDWEKAANELQMDYSSTEFNGTTYYYRD